MGFFLCLIELKRGSPVDNDLTVHYEIFENLFEIEHFRLIVDNCQKDDTE